MIYLQLAGSISGETLGEQELQNLQNSAQEALQYGANVRATRMGLDDTCDSDELLPDRSPDSTGGSPLLPQDRSPDSTGGSPLLPPDRSPDDTGGSPLPLDRSLTLVITDDAQVQDLNRDFLGFDEPTDVLSFPSGESEPDPDTGEVYLGDIIISYPRAQAQAEAGGHPIQQELQLLVVHGVLHLLGYDHADEEEKAEMWTAQEAILKRLGSSLRPPT